MSIEKSYAVTELNKACVSAACTESLPKANIKNDYSPIQAEPLRFFSAIYIKHKKVRRCQFETFPILKEYTVSFKTAYFAQKKF